MKIDLITGFLGAGKTTFLKRYARYFLDAGKRICIIACDFGAINVDRVMLLNELGENCDLEMVTAGDRVSFLRRLKAKLISLGMLGYDRILLEPSGIFDADDFFDVLEEEPLDRWYQMGSVIDLIDPGQSGEMGEAQEYLFASQASMAGILILSKMDERKRENAENKPEREAEDPEQTVARILQQVNHSLASFHCNRRFTGKQVLSKEETEFTPEDFQRIALAGFSRTDIKKIPIAQNQETYQTLFYYHMEKSKEDLREILQTLFADPEQFGTVIRVKGYIKDSGNDLWLEINVTKNEEVIQSCKQGQEVILVIGEGLKEREIGEVFGENRRVSDYEV